MAPHVRWLCILVPTIVGLAGFGLTSACQEVLEPLEVRLERMTTCKVIKLKTSTSTACMVECSRRPGAYEATVASTPVPCEGWYGQAVTRE